MDLSKDSAKQNNLQKMIESKLKKIRQYQGFSGMSDEEIILIAVNDVWLYLLKLEVKRSGM